MKRVFMAIDISATARDMISKYIQNLRAGFSHVRVGWEKPEKLHLTLKFIGDIDGEQLTKLTEAVEISVGKSAGFKLQIAGTGVFPSAKKAFVLWLGVRDEEGSLLKLNRILETECKKQGFSADTKQFKPHLTIARLREPRDSGELVQPHLQEKFEPVEFEVPEIVIYESELQPTGSVYKKIKSFSLSD